jgi:hypothetical protein
VTDDDPDQPAPDDEPQNDLAAPPDDPLKRKAYERDAERRRRESRESEAFWREVFASQVGRREMWRLLSELHPFEDRFMSGPTGFPDANATWFQAGQQSFGARLHRTWFKREPANVILMHTEHDPDFQRSDKRSTRKSE